MAVYTTQVRTIVESLAGNSPGEYPDVNTQIQKALPSIFNFSYPIWKEEYRNVLETKIIKHYYTREIGLETYGLWKLKLDTKLNEIMPYYNKLYESEEYRYNPLWDYEEWRTHIGKRKETTEDSGSREGHENATGRQDTTITKDTKNTGTDTVTGKQTGDDHATTDTDTSSNLTGKVTSNSESENNHERGYSNTPQGNLANVDNLRYLTEYEFTKDTGLTIGAQNTTQDTTANSGTQTDSDYVHNDSTTTEYGHDITEDINNYLDTTNNKWSTDNTENTRKFDSTDDYIEHVVGKSAAHTYPELILQYRETLLNIDMMIIRDLKDLFMQIY